jgi:cytochrome c oxidase assembly protein subunit 15
MFAFPIRMWKGGILFEHTHRLMGTVVGMLSILLTVWAWRLESRRWVRLLAASTLLAVIFQGVLGGLRVVLVKLDLAIVHACVAQAFFCLAALVAVVTSRWWIEAPDLSQTSDAVRGRRLIAACLFAVITLYAQLIVGATMRHYQVGLAVPDVPLAYGKLLPQTDPASLAGINQHRAWDLHLPAVTASQIWLHMGHRLGAILVTLIVLHVITVVLLRHSAHRVLLRPAILLGMLLVAQITLGVLTVLKRKPADIASAHVAIGALTLMTTFVLTVRAIRLFAKRQATASVVQPAMRSSNPVGDLAMA